MKVNPMRPRFPDDEKARKTLFIDMWSSECGNCGQGALASQVTHDRCYGYGEQPPGCGVKFEYVGTNYSMMKNRIMRNRPDLEFYSPYGLPERVL